MNVKQAGSTEEDSSLKTNVNVDELLAEAVGPNGLWQWMVTLLLAFSTPSPATFPVYVHSAGKHRCRMEDKVEEFITRQKIPFELASMLTDPFNSNQSNFAASLQQGCQRYRMEWKAINLMTYFAQNTSSMVMSSNYEMCPNGYVFDSGTQDYPDTIIAEFEALCDRAWLAPLGTSMYMVGMLCGFLMGGWLGSSFGRKKTLIGFCLLEIIATIGVSLAPNVAVYILMRAIVAIGHTVKISVGGVLVLEITLARYRSVYGGVLSIFLDFVYRGAIALWAFLIPSWRWLNIAVMCPSLLVVFYFYFVPESPRWLVSQNKFDESLQVLRFGQRINNICCTSRRNDIHTELAAVEVATSNKHSKANNKQQMCPPTVFKTTHLAKTTILAAFVTFGIVMAFFGLLFYAESIKGSVYLIGFYNSLSALPAVTFATLAYHRIQSRKLPLIVVLVIATACMAISSLYTMLAKPSTDTVLIIGSNIALMMMNMAICMIYIYIPELFPSDTRTSGFGIAMAFSRIGTVICTYINELDRLHAHGLPLILYAITTVIPLISLLFLKDVNGCNLLDITVSPSTPSSTEVSEQKEFV